MRSPIFDILPHTPNFWGCLFILYVFLSKLFFTKVSEDKDLAVNQCFILIKKNSIKNKW